MTTLLPIPKGAQEKLKEGQAVLLETGGSGGGIAVCFEEDYPKAAVPDWKVETGWDNLKGER
jgi:hypothetical protein